MQNELERHRQDCMEAKAAKLAMQADLEDSRRKQAELEDRILQLQVGYMAFLQSQAQQASATSTTTSSATPTPSGPTAGSQSAPMTTTSKAPSCNMCGGDISNIDPCLAGGITFCHT